MQMPGQAQGEQQDVAFWIRWGARILGVVGGVLSLALGLWTIISISAVCWFAGLLEMTAGFLVVACEAPFCCMWLDFIEKIAMFSERCPHFVKALVYCVAGIMPMVFCFELSTFLGSGTIFLCGLVYGFMALGKKADRATMMARAQSESTQNIGGPNQPADAAAWDSRVDPSKPYP